MDGFGYRVAGVQARALTFFGCALLLIGILAGATLAVALAAVL